MCYHQAHLSGFAFCTRRRRKPKRFKILLMVFSQGSSSWRQAFLVIKASRMALAVIRVYLTFKRRLKFGINLAFRPCQRNNINFQLRHFFFRFFIAASLKIINTNDATA